MKNSERIITTVKKSRVIYGLYFHIMSFLIKVLKILVAPDERLFLFVSYGGRYFNDSPRCLYEKMKSDSRFERYRLVWAFRNPSQFKEVEDKVRIDSLSYFVTSLKARCWITNVHIERGLDYKGKNTFYFNTTHTLLPKVNSSLINKDNTFTTKAKSKCDFYCAQCQFEQDIMTTIKDKVHVIGYPKNDILANYTEGYRKSIRKDLGYNDDVKIVLFAPTYREGYLAEAPIPVDFSIWEKKLGKEYRVLFRAHPVYAKRIHINESSDFVKDVSAYPNNTELLIASDVLISDYSGIFFEFGVQNKPMFCFAYDYDEYTRIRPLYFDIRRELPGGFFNEDELLDYIKNGDKDEIMLKVHEFKAKYIQAYGNATERCLDVIYKNTK